jgi:DNA-binding transcriptional ArsR family regulator
LVESDDRRARAQALRALAHPMRIEILGCLRVDGPATSAMLARRLGTDSGQTSHHLRQLERHGFIAEAPELGKGPRGRERWWRAVTETTALPNYLEEDETGYADAARAMAGAAQEVWQRIRQRYEAEAARQEWSPQWQQAANSGDFVLHTTPEGLEALWAEVAEVVKKHDRAGQPAPGAETVVVIMHTFPRKAAG